MVRVLPGPAPDPTSAGRAPTLMTLDPRLLRVTPCTNEDGPTPNPGSGRFSSLAAPRPSAHLPRSVNPKAQRQLARAGLRPDGLAARRRVTAAPLAAPKPGRAAVGVAAATTTMHDRGPKPRDDSRPDTRHKHRPATDPIRLLIIAAHQHPHPLPIRQDHRLAHLEPRKPRHAGSTPSPPPQFPVAGAA